VPVAQLVFSRSDPKKAAIRSYGADTRSLQL